jgi:hypothetical protein
MSRARIVTSIFALIALTACDKADKTPSASQATGASTITNAAPLGESTAAAATATGQKTIKKMEPVITYKSIGLSTPESVAYDDVADLYLVSNIEGQPGDADGKGFISRLTPDGKVDALRWIDSGKNNVKLNAPKGLALMGDMLYVADLDTVRVFDRKTGMPKGEVKVPGATFLNDLAATPDGRIVVSDTGVKSTAKGMEPSGTDAVYAIDKAKKLTTLAKSKDLGGPNGLLAMGDKIWVVTMESGELYSLDAKGRKGDVKKLPKGQLDGIVALPDGDVLISSWEANAVFRGKPTGQPHDFSPIIENVKAPADIGFDTKRSRVMIPLFNDSEVQVYEVK